MHAVIHEQLETFQRVPGIGKKTAQKILFHMSDRIEAGDGLQPLTVMDDSDSEVLEALVALGYSVVEAGTALQSIPKGTPETRFAIKTGQLSGFQVSFGSLTFRCGNL
jgi:Holliday junction DNA helicase RuvA